MMMIRTSSALLLLFTALLSQGSNGQNMTMCESGKDCEKESYCAGGFCTPIGECTTNTDCFNPSNGPFAVPACVGYMSCGDEGTCDFTCGIEECADGIEFVSCDEENLPCDVLTCPEAETCYNNPCGGGTNCTAIFYDAAGNIVCDAASDVAEPANPNIATCASDSDCKKGEEYCASGICLLFGECQFLSDCFNPSNGPFMVNTCEGYMDCTEGTCGIVCGGSICADGSDPVQCLVSPCESLNFDSCTPEVVSCMDDYCGGCNVIAFDAAGFQASCGSTGGNATESDGPGAQPAAGDDSMLGMSCTSDADCLHSMEGRQGTPLYCGQGTCMEGGTCSDDADCYNPANSYAVIECVGAISCGAGQCGRICGPGCADGTEWVQCDPPPCLETECAGSVSCVNDQCNGCNAVFYDAAGNVMTDCAEPELFNATGGSVSAATAMQTLFSMVGAIMILFGLMLV